MDPNNLKNCIREKNNEQYKIMINPYKTKLQEERNNDYCKFISKTIQDMFEDQKEVLFGKLHALRFLRDCISLNNELFNKQYVETTLLKVNLLNYALKTQDDTVETFGYKLFKDCQNGTQDEKILIGKSFAILLYRCLQKWGQKFKNDSEFFIIYQELKDKLNFNLANLVVQESSLRRDMNQSQANSDNEQSKQSKSLSPQKTEEKINKKQNSDRKGDQKQDLQKIRQNDSDLSKSLSLQKTEEQINKKQNSDLKVDQKQDPQKIRQFSPPSLEQDQLIIRAIQNRMKIINNNLNKIIKPNKEQKFLKYYKQVKDQYVRIANEMQNLIPKIKDELFTLQYNFVKKQIIPLIETYESQKVVFLDVVKQGDFYIKQYSDQNQTQNTDQSLQESQVLGVSVENIAQSLPNQNPNSNKNNQQMINQNKNDQIRESQLFVSIQDSSKNDIRPQQQQKQDENQLQKPPKQQMIKDSIKPIKQQQINKLQDILNDQQQGKQTCNKYGEIKKRIGSPSPDTQKEKSYQKGFFEPSKAQNNAILSKELENQQIENQSLKSKLDIIKNQNNQLMQQNFTLQNQNEEFQKNLKKTAEKIEISENHKKTLEQELQKSNQQSKNYEKEISKLQQCNIKMVQELQLIQQQKGKEQNILNDELVQERLKNIQLIESHDKQLKQERLKNIQLTEINEKQQKEKQQKQNEIEILKQKLNILQQDLEKKHLELGDKDHIIQSSEYKTLLIDRDNYKMEQENQIKTNHELTQKNNLLREQLINCQTQINRKHEEHNQLKEMQDKLLQITTEEKQKMAETTEEEILKMEKEIQIKDNLLENLNNDYEKLQQLNKEQGEKMQECENNYTLLQEQYDNLQKEYDELLEKYDSANQDFYFRGNNQYIPQLSNSDDFKKKKLIFEPFKPPNKSLNEIDPNLSKSQIQQIPPNYNNSERLILDDLTPKKKDMNIVTPLKLSDFINQQKESGENWIATLDMQSTQQIHEQQGNIYHPEIFDSAVSSANDSFINTNIKNMVQDIRAYQSIEADLIYPFNTPQQYFQNKAFHEPKGKLITSNLKELETLIKDPNQRLRFKKACLKNKSQIYLNDSIQIGVLTDLKINQNECGQIISMFFKNVGSQVIQSFQVEYIYQQDIVDFYEQPQSLFTSIQVENQIRQDLLIELKSIPYQISLCQILYKMGGFSKKIVFPLPSTINKLIEQTNITLNEFQKFWKEAKISLIRSNKFYLDTEIVNNAYHFLHYFPYFLEINQNKAENYKMGLSENRIGGYLYLRQTNTAMLMKIIVYPNSQAVIQLCYMNEEDILCHQNAIIQLLNSYVLIFGKSK